MKPNDGNKRPETGADLDSQLQRWQAASILREQFPDMDASILASAIWKVFSDGRETCSNSELVQRCFAMLEKREKGQNL